jgi:membrane protein implicated in regulation of membrane protease activity
MSGVLPYWAWLTGGLALCLAETLAPGAFLIFIGIAGLAVGAVDFVYPLPLAAQTLAFAALAAALALAGKRLYGSLALSSESRGVNRAHNMVGREFYLDGDIARGFGRIRVGDSVWRVSGPDLPSGEKVRVVRVVGEVTLEVEKA